MYGKLYFIWLFQRKKRLLQLFRKVAVLIKDTIKNVLFNVSMLITSRYDKFVTIQNFQKFQRLFRKPFKITLRF